MTKLLAAPCSQEELKETLHYNPKTGKFKWLKETYKIKAGAEAGFPKYDKNDNYYIVIKINKKAYRGHKLAWYYMTGEWVQVDHKDRNTENNKFKNLRPATNQENGANRVWTNPHGYKGVTKITKSNKFQASICVNYKSIYLGCFDTPEQAHAAYKKAAKTYHGKFANVKSK